MMTENQINAIMSLMVRNYPAILRRVAMEFPRSRGDITIYDVVHGTVLKIVKDEHAATITSDEEFIKYFLYRANTVLYKEIHDKKQNVKAYAYYHKEICKDESEGR